MRTLCEVVAQDIMPALRALVSRELISTYNLSQTETAKLLGVSQPAVSQYLRQLRGDRAKSLENGRTYDAIKELCGRLQANEVTHAQLMVEFCRICNVAIRDGNLKIGKDLHGVNCEVYGAKP